MTSAPHIRAGGLRHYAELQARVPHPDSGGGDAITWTTERNLWCQIRPLSGTRKLEAMQRESSVSHEIYARFQDDVAPGAVEKKRILYNGEPYDIQAAWRPGELDEFVHMVASRGVAT